MLKFIKKVYFPAIAFIIGWVVFPYFLKYAYGSCTTVSFSLFKANGKKIESKIIRVAHFWGNENIYYSQILVTLPNGEKIIKKISKKEQISWSVNNSLLKGNVITVYNDDSTGSEWEEKVNKLSESGVVGNIYFYMTTRGRILTGNINNPTSICNNMVPVN